MENNEVEKANVLITGATSAVGLAVMRDLARAGHKVYGTTVDSDGASTIRAAGGHPVYPDLSRASEVVSTLKMAKTDVLIHLEPASYNTVPFNVKWDADVVKDSTVAIVKAAEEAGVNYLVYVSFAFLYEKSDSADEHAKLVSPSTNGIVKAALEAEKAVKNSSIPSIILRAGYTYGAESEALAKLPDMLRTGRPVVGTDTPASWVHAHDLASAITLSVQKRPAVDVLNITDGTHLSTNSFLEKFSHAIGIGAPGGLPGFLKGIFAPKSASELMALGSNVNSAQARSTLGWEPAYPTVEKGLDQILLKWRATEGTT